MNIRHRFNFLFSCEEFLVKIRMHNKMATLVIFIVTGMFWLFKHESGCQIDHWLSVLKNMSGMVTFCEEVDDITA